MGESSPVTVSIKDADSRATVESTLSIIDSVHRVPADAPALAVRHANRAGLYDPNKQQITGAFWDDADATTFVHEFGHYLDFSVLGAADDYGTSTGKAKGVLAAIRASDAHKELETKYLRDPAELWARGYEQWIATRSGNETLRSAIADMVRLEGGGQYWSDDDFQAIGEAFDALFRDLGLLV